MVLIPYALTYTTTVRGQVPKLVRCEKCDFEFVYLLQQTVAAEATSLLFLDNEGARDRSAAQAEAVLRQNLATGCEVVPCRSCGHVQDHMIPLARRRRHRWMWTLGLVLLGAAGVLIIPALLYALLDGLASSMTGATLLIWTGVGAALGGGIAAIVGRSLNARRYDPNSEPVESRKRVGETMSVSKVDYFKSA